MSARYHHDGHIRGGKLILEATQLLSTAIRTYYQNLYNSKIYKKTHEKHPCTLACIDSREIFQYTYDLAEALNDERKYRFDTDDHKSIFIARECMKYIDCVPYKNIDWPLAMPYEYKCADSVVSYRQYYINAKQKMKNNRWMMYYTRREIPDWIPDWLKEKIKEEQLKLEMIF